MSAYCLVRQHIYMDWVTEPDPIAKNTLYNQLQAHHRTCATCRQHMSEMTQAAMNAKHPEYREE